MAYDPKLMTELIAKLQAGQSALVMAVLGLLIDKGVLAREEVIAELERVSAEASRSEGGLATASVVDNVLNWLRSTGSQGPPETGSKSH